MHIRRDSCVRNNWPGTFGQDEIVRVSWQGLFGKHFRVDDKLRLPAFDDRRHVVGHGFEDPAHRAVGRGHRMR